jgi:hypothetical protein
MTTRNVITCDGCGSAYTVPDSPAGLKEAGLISIDVYVGNGGVAKGHAHTREQCMDDAAAYLVRDAFGRQPVTPQSWTSTQGATVTVKSSKVTP